MPYLFLSRAAYQSILYIWIGVALLLFFLLLKITAPYGRHSAANWGPMIANSTGWLLMELPVLLVLWLVLFTAIKNVSAVSWVMISLFCLHYLYRSLIFPFRLHTKGKKMPLVIVGSAILFNIINGFSMGYYFTRFAGYTNSWFSDRRFIVGVLLFFTGMYINQKADNTLIHLRKPDETGYKIPTGWLFNTISCPNLLGELIEWTGFAILCWNLPAFTFFTWTAANLVPRALSHHKWYREYFDVYPVNRKAIFPGFL